MTTLTLNKFPATCALCSLPVPKGGGYVEKDGGEWVVKHTLYCLKPVLPKPTPRPEPTLHAVGQLHPLHALFKRAAIFQKASFILVSAPIGKVNTLRLMPDGPRVLVFDHGAGRAKAAMLGTVTPQGAYMPTRLSMSTAPAVATALVAMAADPKGEAALFGKLHRRCCFCNRPLADERSKEVGYGRTCADVYNLPWGSVPAMKG